MTQQTQQANHKTIEQAEQEGKYIRKIRSFVKREGRLTAPGGPGARTDATPREPGAVLTQQLIDLRLPLLAALGTRRRLLLGIGVLQ